MTAAILPPPIPLVTASHGAPTAMTSAVRIGHGLYAELDLRGLERWQALGQVNLARCASALLQVPSAVCLCHESAAVVHGLPLPLGRREPDVSVVVPSAPSRTTTALPRVLPGRAGVVLRRRRCRLTPDEVTTVGGLRVTTLRRTVLDCAFDLPAADAVCLIDAAMRALIRPGPREDGADRLRALREAEWYRRELLEAVAGRPRRPGSRRARAVLGIASPLAESPGESVLRWFVAALGLPDPELQLGVDVVGGCETYWPDLVWPEHSVYLEFDGLSKYQSSEDLRREKRRRDALARSGWRCEHVTWADLRHPPRLRSRILGLFPAEVLRSLGPVADLWR